MKTFIFLFGIFTLFSCLNSKKNVGVNKYSEDLIDSNSMYRVYKIDSINSYYLIYASRKDTLFKIVSKKDYANNLVKIKNDKMYFFDLFSFSSERKKINPKMPLQNSLLVNCFGFDDSTIICLERDSINDLHFARNLVGLYIK